MSRALIVKARAREQWGNVYDHYNRIRHELALELNAEVERALNCIADNPTLPRIEYRGFRSVPAGKFPFRIYYFVTDAQIVVAVMFHKRRNPRQLLRELRER